VIAIFLGNLEAVFGWLLAASWQASVLVLFVLLIQGMLGARLNPRWRYALWLLVLLRLVLPTLPESTLSLFQFAPQPPVSLIAPVTEPIFPTAPLPAPPIDLPSPEPIHPFSLYSLLALVWLAGAMILLVLTWHVNRQFARQMRNSPETTDPDLLKLLATTKTELGLRRSIRLIECAQVESPAIMGLFHPTLLLPADVREKFDATELRLIFLHEMAHLKRGDVIVQGLIALLQILHWFNPVLWLAFRQIRADREPATDALVLSRAGEDEKERYGLMLIKLLEHFNQRHSLPTLVGILEDKDQFKRRFSLIAKFTRGAYGWSLLGALVIGVLTVACLTKGEHKVIFPPKDAEVSAPGNNPETKVVPPTLSPSREHTVHGYLIPQKPNPVDFSKSSGELIPVDGLAMHHYPFTIQSDGSYVVSHVTSGVYNPTVHLVQNNNGDSTTPAQSINMGLPPFTIDDGTVNETLREAIRVRFEDQPKGSIEIGLKIGEMDDDIYQANRDKIDAAVEQDNLAYLINNFKGMSMLSTPRVSTKPGLKATIDIVREFPYPTSFDNAHFAKATYLDGSTDTTITITVPATPRAFVTKDLGVSAEITPSLGDENSPDHGKIILNGKFSVTDFEGFTKSNLVGTGTPSFTTRESFFLEALDDNQEKGIWIPGAYIGNQTTGYDSLVGSNVVPATAGKKHLLLFLSAKLVK